MKENLRCQLITLQDVYDLSFSLAQKILASSFRPDVIVAIARGGFVPARFLCDFLDVKAMSSIGIRHYLAAASKEPQAQRLDPVMADVKDKRVLITDDVNDSGETLQVAVDYMATFSPSEVQTAVLHEKSNSSFQVQFKSKIITEWRWVIYPWAVVEDVGGLILREYSAVIELEDLRQRLLKDHEIDVSRDVLKKVMMIHSHHRC